MMLLNSRLHLPSRLLRGRRCRPLAAHSAAEARVKHTSRGTQTEKA